MIADIADGVKLTFLYVVGNTIQQQWLYVGG